MFPPKKSKLKMCALIFQKRAKRRLKDQVRALMKLLYHRGSRKHFFFFFFFLLRTHLKLLKIIAGVAKVWTKHAF